MVLDLQVCQVSTWAISEGILFILHTVPVACSADPKLIRDSVLLLPETLKIQVLTRESESGKSAGKMGRDIVS